MRHAAYDARGEVGVLILQDKNGQGERCTADRLGTQLRDETSLRLVVLNAWEGGHGSEINPFDGTAQTLAQQGVPAIIAMQFKTKNDTAIRLAMEFYGALADGYPVEATNIKPIQTLLSS